MALPPGWLETLDAGEQRCTALVGRRGFTLRAATPVARGEVLELVGPAA